MQRLKLLGRKRADFAYDELGREKLSEVGRGDDVARSTDTEWRDSGDRFRLEAPAADASNTLSGPVSLARATCCNGRYGLSRL